MSGREAVRLLACAGVGERQARQVLAAGLAGTPQRVSGALLYDDALVNQLVHSPYVDEVRDDRRRDHPGCTGPGPTSTT